MPFMSVYNNLVMFDPKTKQNTPDNIVPDLATEWNWSDDGKELTFKLRDGVKWHDGKPFTSADVKCTWDMLIADESQAAQEPAQDLVLQPEGGDGQRRPRGRPSISSGRSPRCSPCSPAPSRRSIPATSRRPQMRHQADRHRPVQVRRAEAERSRSSSRATRTTGSRAGPISTRSSSRSSPTGRRRCWPSSPASST